MLLSSGRPRTAESEAGDDGLEIVVTEAHDTSPELVGGVSSQNEGLGVQSTAELMQEEATSTEDRNRPSESITIPAIRPIGESEPPPPPGAIGTANDPPEPMALEAGGQQPQDPDGIRKLSDEQVSSIKEQLYGSENSYLDNREKLDLLKKMEQDPPQPAGNAAKKGFDTAPIVPPKKKSEDKKAGGEPAGREAGRTSDQKPAASQKKPHMAQRIRGVAYFAKNIIQITGVQDLYDGDEMIIKDREYVLKKKKFSSKVLFIVGAPIAAALLFLLGTLFTADHSGGSGKVIGLVLDHNGQPFKQGAEVRLPTTGKTYKCDAQGFFKTDLLERGSYKIEYVLNGQIVRTDFATVVNGEVTTIALRPDKTGPARPSSTRTAQRGSPPSRPQQTVEQSSSSTTQAAKSPPKKSSKSTGSSASRSEKSKLRLAANVEGARLVLDGSVIGAGNLTYSGLKPGKHSYKVSADGYATKSGTISLKSGETSSLKVTLQPLATTKKTVAAKEEDFFRWGLQALNNGDRSKAITEFTKAIQKQPDNADAYFHRAEALEQSAKPSEATDDYVQAAQHYRKNRNHRNASTCYSRAIGLDPKCVPALLGRGSLYLAKGEEIAAMADFETVKDIDKRNPAVYMGLGEARFRQGYYKKATKHFNDAKSLDSKNPSVYQFLMLCYLARDDVNKVRKTFDRFTKVASEQELRSFYQNDKYASVRDVIEGEN
ncbi:MAG: tetratricopeptide repeat protein [Candidatus Zixiibacteriota bacterium]|nr:MAG: tetratricopeptide repeat protein [candidate division Zixibacteria bacterium]